jgi:hypothetical protein
MRRAFLGIMASFVVAFSSPPLAAPAAGPCGLPGGHLSGLDYDIDERPSLSRAAQRCLRLAEPDTRDYSAGLQHLCRAIALAHLPEPPSSAFDYEQRAVIADLWNASIPGSSLVRILTAAPDFPRHATGGLHLKRAHLTGGLGLNGAAVSFPVTVTNSCIEGEQRDWGGTTRPVSLNVRGSQLSSISIFESTIRGHVNLTNSLINGGMDLRDNVFSIITDHKDPFSLVHLRDSEISGTLVSMNNTYRGPINSIVVISSTIGGVVSSNDRFSGLVSMEGNQLGHLAATGTHFDGGLSVRLNTLAGMVISNSSICWTSPRLCEQMKINFNTVTGTAEIEETKIGSGRTSKDLESPGEHVAFEFGGNAIEGDLRFVPSHLSSNVDLIDLKDNVVGGYMNLHFPPVATHDLTATLLHSRSKHLYVIADKKREEPAILIKEEKENEPSVCHGLTIDLRDLRTDTLSWQIPKSVAHCWKGSGLRFRHWASKSDENSGEWRDGDYTSLIDWASTLKDGHSEVLQHISIYLESRGKFNDARDVLRDAKEKDYEVQPRCKRLVLPIERDSCVRQAFVYSFLWPTGFGVKPELGIFWLIVVWLVFAALYGTYSSYWSLRTGKKPWLLLPPGVRFLAQAGKFLAQRLWNQCRAVWRALRIPVPRESTKAGSGLREAHQPFLPQHDGRRPAGFSQFEDQRQPPDFRLLVYSLDAVLPVVDLHAYNAYYPEALFMRLLVALERVLGWLLVSSIIASLAVF